MQEPQRPRVTVSDPRTPGRFVVQEVEPEPEPDPVRLRTTRGPSRRGRRTLALAAAAALGFGAAELRQDQQDRREADRLGQALDLRLTALSDEYVRQPPGPRGSREVHLAVQVSNRGPLPVRLVDVTVEGGDLVADDDSLKELPAGEDARLELEQILTCPSDVQPRSPGTGSRVVLRVQTAGGPQETRVLLPEQLRFALKDYLDTACGFVPDELALEVFAESGLLRDGEGRVSVRLVNRSAKTVRVTGVEQLAPGLRTELRGGPGRPLPLPLELPPSRFGAEAPDLIRDQSRVYVLAVGVLPGQCALARAAVAASRQSEYVSFSYEVTPETGGSGGGRQGLFLTDDSGVLDSVVRTACP